MTIAHSLSQLAQALFASQADKARVRSLIEECLTLSREVGFKEGIAAAYSLVGQMALGQGDVVTARAQVEESVVLYKEMGHRYGTAESLAVLGKVLAAEGDYAAACKLYEESLELIGFPRDGSDGVLLGGGSDANRHCMEVARHWGARVNVAGTSGRRASRGIPGSPCTCQRRGIPAWRRPPSRSGSAVPARWPLTTISGST